MSDSEKLERLHEDFNRLQEWAADQGPENLFADQVAQYAVARLAEGDLPLEEWEP